MTFRGFLALSCGGMSTLPTSLIAVLTGFITALFYAVPDAFCLEIGSSGASPSFLASGGNRAGARKPDNISQKARDLIPFKKLIARGPGNADPPKQGTNGAEKSQRIEIEPDKTTPDFDMQPPGEGKVNLRAPISLDKPEESNSQPSAQTTQSSTKPSQSSTLKPMGVIRFDDDRRADRKNLTGGLSIFSCLDEALVKSPRAAAMRAYLPVTKALFARATEQPSPQFFYDEGVRAEQNRRLGSVFNWEPPWKLVFRLLVAKQSVSARKLELMAQLWLLRADVRRAYTEVVVAQETLETLTSLYDLAHRLRVVSEKRFAAGDVPELDLLKARLAESRYDVERRVGLRRVIRAKQQLNIIMGRAPEQDINVPRLPPFLRTKDMKGAVDVRNPLLPDFARPMPSLDSFIARAVENRYELKTINQNLVLNKANMRRTIGDIAPTPQFWIGQSSAGNPPVGPKLNAYYVGVSVPTQITSFNQGDIAEFKAQGRQLKYEYGAQKNIITAEVSSAYNNVLAARQWLKVYEDHVLADSYEVARLARRSYEVGQSDITSTLQAQQNNVQIRSLYLEAITLYQKAFTELEMACGTPLLEED
ncbi:hypothetical protein GC174_01980 [bacterium]|nr:hypothetical protein [bacterium]